MKARTHTKSIIDTPFGGEQLHLNGYIYYKHETRKSGKTYWRCSQRQSHDCYASAVTHSTGNRADVLKEGKHNHPHANEDISHRGSFHGDQREFEEERDAEQHDEDGEEQDAGGEDRPSSCYESSEYDEESSTEEEQSFKDEEWEAWEEDTDVEDSGAESNDRDDELVGQNDDMSDDDNDGDDDYDDSSNVSVDASELRDAKIKKYGNILRVLRQESAPMREAIYKSADKGLICLLSEICWNFLRGVLNLSKNEINLLRPFEDQLRVMSSEKMTWMEKKDYLVETARDGFIPVLLNVVKLYIGPHGR